MTAWGAVIAVMVGVLLGLGGFTFHYGEGLSYFSQDPAACVNCHIMQIPRKPYDCPSPRIRKWLAKGEKFSAFQSIHFSISLSRSHPGGNVATCVFDCHSRPHDLYPASGWQKEKQLENGFLHSKAFTFDGGTPEPIFIRERNQRILDNNCLNCHSDVVHEILVGSTTDADVIRCMHCHRSVGHGEPVGLGRFESLQCVDLDQVQEK